jgi:hypothetical protein
VGRATSPAGCSRRGGQVPAGGPAGGAVMRAAARVTSCRGHTRKVVPGAAVRDAGRGHGRRDPAGRAPGDVGRRDQVAVTRQPAARAAEHPAGRLGDPGPAGRAGRGGAPLIGQGQGDTGLLSLVTQDGDQVADPPVAGPLVMPSPRVDTQDAARVADRQGADPAREGPADHGAGGFVLGLADPAPVPRLDQPLAAPVVAPPP